MANLPKPRSPLRRLRAKCTAILVQSLTGIRPLTMLRAQRARLWLPRKRGPSARERCAHRYSCSVRPPPKNKPGNGTHFGRLTYRAQPQKETILNEPL